MSDGGGLVIVHASDNGYTRYWNEWEGRAGSETLAFAEPLRFSAVVRGAHREIQDAVTAIICHGLPFRFPKLRFALVENGAGWVPGLLGHLDHTYRTMPQAFEENPVDTFKRHFWMHPFHEEDPRGLVNLLGADHVIFGSDFPHVEGLADPLSYVNELSGLTEAEQAKVMGGNMINLMGLGALV